MKRTSLVLTLLLTLVLVSCTVTPAPTATPSIPATETTTPTLTPTGIVALVETATSPATIPPPPTDVPTLTPTTVLPTETPTPSVLIPVPTGRIYFFWDPGTFTGGLPPAAPKQNLYLALPGSAYDDWQIQTLLEEHLDWNLEAPSHPAVALSPDQTMVAFTVNRDANGDGDVDTPWGGDERDIYVYDLANEFLMRVTGTAFNHDLDWLPDNNTIVFGWGKEVLQIRLNDLTSNLLAGSFPNNIAQIKASPQGNQLVIAVNPSASTPFSLYLHNIETNEEFVVAPEFYVVPESLVWSPDGQWLLSSKFGYSGLVLIEAQTGKVVWESDSPAGVPAWSLDSTQFAFVDTTETTSFLAMFHIIDSTVAQLISGETMTSPIWSPNGTELAICVIEEGLSNLYLVNNAENKISEIFSSSEIKIEKLLSWSPDNQWLLFFGSQTLPEQSQQTGIFLIHRNGYPIHFLLETESWDVNIPPSDFFWLP